MSLGRWWVLAKGAEVLSAEPIKFWHRRMLHLSCCPLHCIWDCGCGTGDSFGSSKGVHSTVQKYKIFPLL